MLQDNHIKLTGRAFQMLVDTFEDHFGIDYERLWKTLVVAQAKSGITCDNGPTQIVSANV